MAKSIQEANKYDYNKLTSFALFTNDGEDFDFNIFFKQSTKREKIGVDENGKAVWKSTKYTPKKRCPKLEKVFEFTNETTKTDLYKVYPKNKIKRLSDSRAANIEKVLNGETASYYLTYTEFDFFVDLAVIETAEGEQIRGIVSHKSATDKQMQKLHIQFKDKVIYCQDPALNIYGTQYNGTRAAKFAKEVATTRIIEDKTPEAIIKNLNSMSIKQIEKVFFSLPKSVRENLVNKQLAINSIQKKRAVSYCENRKNEYLEQHPELIVNQSAMEQLLARL